eukprot:1137982-Prymnesium_polylepis.1
MPTLLLLQALAQAASEAESALKASSAVLTDGSVEMPAEEAGTANNHAEVVAFLPLWIALLLFAAATAALCLCGYFHISLSAVGGFARPHIPRTPGRRTCAMISSTRSRCATSASAPRSSAMNAVCTQSALRAGLSRGSQSASSWRCPRCWCGSRGRAS